MGWITFDEPRSDPYKQALNEVLDKYFPDPVMAKLDAEIDRRKGQSPISVERRKVAA